MTKASRPKHSPIGASSRYRWAKCPGSIRLSKDEPNISGAAAIEGSFAHEILASVCDKALAANEDPLEYMVTYCEPLLIYLALVGQLRKRCEIVLIEHGFDMTEIGHDLYGTADCVAWDKNKGVLHVVDYKHGEGLVVEVKDNPQLEYYALGALTTLKYPCRTVVMTIVQPRAYHPDGPIRSWSVPMTHFLEVEENILQETAATREPNSLLLAGGHCMFCPAKTKCPQRAQTNVRDAKKDFTFYTDPKKDFAPV